MIDYDGKVSWSANCPNDNGIRGIQAISYGNLFHEFSGSRLLWMMTRHEVTIVSNQRWHRGTQFGAFPATTCERAANGKVEG
jgi:hypothetical protein